MIKTYGRRGACRSACMDFPGASMRLQLHNLKSKSKSLTHLSPNFVQPVMPHHSMTLSRYQDKLLQTPATLETLGSTSAVPLHRLEAWKAACVNSWIHRHGPACGKEFVSELSCRNHACRTTAEQRQLSLLASCRFQDKPIGNYLPQTPKRQKLAPNSKPKFDLKNEAIFGFA